MLRLMAPESLMHSYSDERVAAAEENILNSSRATDFLIPMTKIKENPAHRRMVRF